MAKFFAILAVCLLSISPAGGDVIISEFMASNDQTLKDNFGEDSDWIELYNTGPTAVDLGGWRLTDNSNNTSMWVFPSIQIPSNSYLLVFATGRDLKNTANPLHTNFALKTGGEYLALIRPDGSPSSVFSPAFPVQVEDVSYGFPQTTTTTIVPTGASGQVGVPVSQIDHDTNFINWRTSTSNLTGSSWQACQTGIGFDDPAASYGAWIHPTGEISARLKNQQRTACLRVPFTLTNPGLLLSLKLKMRWDDGFIAWINGVQVAANSAPTNPLWNSLGTLNRNEAMNTNWTEFTIDPSSLNLIAGTNILAIQGFNITVTSSDFLVLPELEATFDSSAGTPTYFLAPTPGQPNGTGGPIGPALTDATNSIPRPSGHSSSPQAVASVQVDRTVFNVAPASVRLVYRTMFAAETIVAMRDDGVLPDTTSGDGNYAAYLPTSNPTAGQMLRWRFEATDVNGNTGRAPAFLNATDYDQYYGTVAINSDESTSSLPLLRLFVQDTSASETRAGTRGSLFYLGKFHDNIAINLHGQSTAGFAKKSFDIDFNTDNRFSWSADAPIKAKDINLLSNHADKTRFRNTLAQEVSKMARGIYHTAFPVRVERNGTFHGIMDMVEDGDDRLLERNGLDPDGALYKVYDALISPDNGEKKTRKEEDKSDLQALINGLNPASDLAIRRSYAYDNVDIAATVNYLATRVINADTDHGHKNYYVYRDSQNTGEWRPIIWDVDLTFGHNWTGSAGYFDDTLYTNQSLTPNNSTVNRLYKIIYDSPEMRAMYLRRFRTLMDTVLEPPGMNGGYLETRMRAIVATVDPDVADPSSWTDGDRDFSKWGTWGRGLRPREETEYVITNYLPARRNFLFDISASRQLYNGDPIPNSGQSNSPGMISITEADVNPNNTNPGYTQAQEYIILRNTSPDAVDISGWTLTGAVEHTFTGGTVIPSGDGSAAQEYRGLLHVVKNAAAFRSRTSGPTGGEKRFIQGNYSGQLSARGETIELRDQSNLLVASFTYAGNPTLAQQFLRITELQYHPVDPTPAESAAIPGVTEDDFEYIEFTNTGTAPLTLTGSAFTQGLAYTFPATTLAGGARLVLARNPTAFALRYPGAGTTVLGPYEGQLDNGGERLEIADPSGEIVLDFTYDDGWYPHTDGSGRTLVLRDPVTDPEKFGSAVTWGISGAPGGSPGQADAFLASAYHGWDNFHFTRLERDDPGISGPQADPDGDGRPNWLEYALDRNPRQHDSDGVSFAWANVNGDNHAGLAFQRPAHALDLSYRVLATPNLNSSSWLPESGVVHGANPTENGMESLILRETLPAPLGKRFLRLETTLLP